MSSLMMYILSVMRSRKILFVFFYVFGDGALFFLVESPSPSPCPTPMPFLSLSLFLRRTGWPMPFVVAAQLS